jgi:menaquinone-9 beta-reductase
VPKFDVFIVGGGPAGLAAALALREKGMSVGIADCAQAPIDKACGEGLMPDGRIALRRLGVPLSPQDGAYFRGIRFISDGISVESDFPHEQGIGVRRTVLHRLMSDRAVQVGVSAFWNAQRVELTGAGVMVGNEAFTADFVVGADGLNSPIRRYKNLGSTRHESVRYGFRRHFRGERWSNFVEIYWADGCQVYVTPVAADEISVAVLSSDPKLRLAEAIRRCSRLRDRLQRFAAVTRERGSLTISRRLKRVWTGNTVLLGDASGSLDAITGEGMCLSFKQAQVLAEAIQSGDLNKYRQYHDKISRRPRMMESLMLLLDRHENLRRRVISGFSRESAIFSRFIAIHVGQSSVLDIPLSQAYRFGKNVLAAY